jgi:hypothetical protein
MAWSNSYRATLEGWQPTGQHAWVVGSHDGYARGANGVVHRRVVWLRPDSYLLIYDEFVGNGEHELAVTYQFAPGSFDLAGADGAVYNGSVDIAWISNERWSAARACGGPGPADGWIAPSLGVREPAPRLTLKCRTAEKTSLLAVVAARATSEKRTAIRTGGEGTLALVEGRSYIDCVWAAGIAPAHLVETDAMLAVCRVAREGSIHTDQIGGSAIRIDSSALKGLLTPAGTVRP